MFQTMLTSLAMTAGLIAQPSKANDNLISIPMEVTCVSGRVLAETLEEFGEIPMLQMNSTRETDTGIVTNPTVIFMNPDTKSWTMAERVERDLYCVIAIGDFAMPFRGGKGI